MKVSVYILASVIILFVTSCTNKQTRIQVESDVNYNFGEIQQDASTLLGKEWLIQNIGDVSLKINKVESLGDCINKIMYDSVNAVAPNKYLPFRVLVSPKDTIGELKGKIYIYGNFEESPLELTIEGNIVGNTSENDHKTDS